MAVGAGLLCAVLASCAGIFGFETLQESDGGLITDAPSTDGAMPAPDTGPPSRPGACPFVRPAPPPADAGSASLPVGPTFVADSIDLAPASGLNLDGRCTTERGESSCLLTTNDSFENPAWIDGPDGADIAGNRLLTVYDDSFPALGEDNIKAAFTAGYANLLFEVNAWNGAADDDRIELVVHASRGLQSPTGDAIERRAPDPANPQETWTYTEKSSGGGYVSNGRLVANST